jgi:cyclopropane fatty-acyl-phospholipid synthase-like methyltransferase
MSEDAMYDARIFNVTDIDSAKKIILTPENGQTTKQRWELETPHLLSLMEPLGLRKDSVVLDFGCGIGRLSKAIIDKYGCHVVGSDISMSMRALAPIYVNSDKYYAIPPTDDVYEQFAGKFDAVIAVWVLQHVFKLQKELDNISKLLKPNGKLFVVNERGRVVPTNKGWMDDKQDIFLELARYGFNGDVVDTLDPKIIGDAHTKSTFYGVFTKQENNNGSIDKV